MTRKRKTRKRNKKGGNASGYVPSEDERRAQRYSIPVHIYRQYVNDFNNYGWRFTDAGGDGVSGPQTAQNNLNQFILRRIEQDREQAERQRERRRLADIRARAHRVNNFLPSGIDPNFATLQEVQNAEGRRNRERRRRTEERRRQAEERKKREEEARSKTDENSRSVFVPVINPDGSIQMGKAVLPTIEDAQNLRNEMNEIPVTRPTRLRRMKEIARRVKQFLVQRTRSLRNRTFFGTRNRRNNAIVPMDGLIVPTQGGRKKTRKRKYKKKRTRRVKKKRKHKKRKGKKRH